jgi:hypothetical protein
MQKLFAKTRKLLLKMRNKSADGRTAGGIERGNIEQKRKLLHKG